MNVKTPKGRIIRKSDNPIETAKFSLFLTPRKATEENCKYP